MREFAIWAPKARKMALTLNCEVLPMRGPDEHGWWRLIVKQATKNAEYGFLIDDDEKVYPDPRSQWQPHGVHGLSRVYDHTAFEWSDAGFQAPPLGSGVVYELHVGTFTGAGTLDAAIDKLDYLAGIGVTHVELMPVASFAGEHGWGYDGVALDAVHEPYGGPDALKRFVNAAHGKSLAVLLDVVYNHFGPVGNYTGLFAPYLVDAHHTPWGGAVNLEDAGSHEVRRFFCDNACMWLNDFHVDGLRIDAVHAFVDRSAIHFLEQLAMEVETLESALGRRLILIAESDLNDPRVVRPRAAGGFGIDAQWSDDFHHALFTVLTGEKQGYYADFGGLGQLAKALEQVFVYDGRFSPYRNRVHGRPVGALSRHRFLGYIQNHDQVGNRAVGDRIGQIAGLARAKIAAAMVLTSPFVPLIFQGEEWAASSPFQYFADHEPEMARMVSAGRKREFEAFGWQADAIPDPEDPATFLRSKLHWEETGQAEHAEVLAWYRDLIHLRRTTPSLNDGEPGHTRVSYDEGQKWLRMERGQVTVMLNVGANEQRFPAPEEAKVVLASRMGIALKEGALSMPPETVAIVVTRR